MKLVSRLVGSWAFGHISTVATKDALLLFNLSKIFATVDKTISIYIYIYNIRIMLVLKVLVIYTILDGKQDRRMI